VEDFDERYGGLIGELGGEQDEGGLVGVHGRSAASVVGVRRCARGVWVTWRSAWKTSKKSFSSSWC
jgi:hypothetical protein